MLAMFLDDLRQFYLFGDSLRMRLKAYFDKWWCVLEFCKLVSYVIAIILRTLAYFYDPAFQKFKAGQYKDYGDIYGQCQDGIAKINISNESPKVSGNTEETQSESVEFKCNDKNFCPLLISQNDGNNLFFYALNFYCIAFMFLCLKFLYFFSVSRSMGPLLIAVINMIKDVLNFILILFILMMAFGVSSSALLYPNDWRVASIDWKTKWFFLKMNFLKILWVLVFHFLYNSRLVIPHLLHSLRGEL